MSTLTLRSPLPPAAAAGRTAGYLHALAAAGATVRTAGEMTLIVLVLLAVFVAVMMQATSENGKKPVLLSEFVFQYVLIVMLITATALFAAVAMAIKMLLH